MKQRVIIMEGPHSNIVARIINDDGDLDYWLEIGYVEISWPVEIEFPELDKSDIVNNKIAVIDSKIKSVMAESESTINRLKEKKQELLALTYEESNNE